MAASDYIKPLLNPIIIDDKYTYFAEGTYNKDANHQFTITLNDGSKKNWKVTTSDGNAIIMHNNNAGFHLFHVRFLSSVKDDIYYYTLYYHSNITNMSPTFMHTNSQGYNEYQFYCFYFAVRFLNKLASPIATNGRFYICMIT